MTADRGYYRHPTIHGDRIAFVTEDDLWTVPTGGGIARRLTTTPGAVAFPYFSPDGRKIACTAREEGHAEVYVMDADGGPARRITWLGSGTVTQVAGWSPDGTEVLFSSDWKQRQRGFGHLFAIGAGGGAPRALRSGPARAISFQQGGPGVVIGRNSGDPARWKRYRGGTAGTLWIDRAGDGAYTQFLRLEGNVASPMWIEGRIYFLSDHEGIGNLYSCTPTGRDIRRHTHHGDYYVRFPSTDGSRIVYHAGADLFFFDVRSGREQAVDVRLLSSRTQRNRKFVPSARYLEGFDLHPKGHSIASVHRGRVYSMPLWEGAATRRDVNDAARHRLARWLADGKRIVATTDEAGEESLIVLSANGSAAPRRIDGDFGRLIELRAAPAGPDRVALTNQRQELIVVDLASGRSKRIERSEYGRIEGIAWSPDGRWLAYGFADARRTMQIRLWDASTGKVAAATRTGFRDYRPSFDPEGKYLYFLSDRVFDPVWDNHYFDAGFPKGILPMLLPLRKEIVSPFSAATREPRAPGVPNGAKKEVGNGEKEAEAAKPKPPGAVTIDLDGIEDRAVAFPVPEARYGRILGAANGRVLLSSYPVEGSLNQSWADFGEPPAKGRLEAYDLEQQKTELVMDRISDFQVSIEAKTIGVRAGNRVRALSSSHKDQKLENDAPGRESGWLDLDRIRVSVVPQLEWRQMFREAWRLQRDQFWVPDMSGIDWTAVHDRYAPLVDRVASRAEFSDLLWEMQGELGTSHCYEMGGDYRPEPAWHQGFLGADLELNGKSGAWRIARIPRGDSWDEKKRSPLSLPGLDIHEGDEILAVAGQPVGREVSPYERLTHLAQQDVQLTIRSNGTAGAEAKRAAGRRAARGAGASSGTRTVVVRTLREEYDLRYRDWVEGNRAWVHEASGGKVGYLHIPDMSARGYSEFHRYFAAEVDYPGLIIDVRWNGGGNVSQLLLGKLLRRRVGYDANRWAAPEPYPTDSPVGPMVALTNEYAGSDGDIFSHCFKLYGLGPLIGKRTWGGVVGIWPRHTLVDGSITTQPEFAFWFEDVGWKVENYGTDPDIEVDIRPQDYAAGVDPQLQRGLSEVQKRMRKHALLAPDLDDRPRLRFEGLPGEPKAKRSA